jgi:hypothetical protein
LKIIEVIWRDPSGSIVSEKLEEAKFEVLTSNGWMELRKGGELVRLIPSEKVCLVQFQEIEEKPRILRPSLVDDTPNKFQTS